MSPSAGQADGFLTTGVRLIRMFSYSLAITDSFVSRSTPSTYSDRVLNQTSFACIRIHEVNPRSH